MLTIAEIIVAIILIVLILIQERSSGLSGVLGGFGGTPYQTRRGMEKLIFRATIGAGVLFFLLAIANLVI